MAFHCRATLTNETYTAGALAKVEKKKTLSDAVLREFLGEMLMIRRFEEKVEERFRAGELPGFLHVAIGQEATAVGVCRAMVDPGHGPAPTVRHVGTTKEVGHDDLQRCIPCTARRAGRNPQLRQGDDGAGTLGLGVTRRGAGPPARRVRFRRTPMAPASTMSSNSSSAAIASILTCASAPFDGAP